MSFRQMAESNAFTQSWCLTGCARTRERDWRRRCPKNSFVADFQGASLTMKRSISRSLVTTQGWKVVDSGYLQGNSTDEDQSSQSSKGLGEWDIPDWMPKKRAVRRRHNLTNTIVKNAAKRARDMWANRSQKKNIFQTTWTSVMKRKTRCRKISLRHRASCWNVSPDAKSTNADRRLEIKREFTKISTTENSNKPGRLSYISVPSSESPRIRRMSNVPSQKNKPGRLSYIPAPSPETPRMKRMSDVPSQKNKPGRLSYISVPSSESPRIKRMSDVHFFNKKIGE